jgi:hypothetical protein
MQQSVEVVNADFCYCSVALVVYGFSFFFYDVFLMFYLLFEVSEGLLIFSVTFKE